MCFTYLLYRIISYPISLIRYKKHRFRTFIADSAGRQMLGLMHRPSMKAGEAMLFVFGREGRQGIWMLNMKFAIDILWLDPHGRIVDLVADAQPCGSVLGCRTYLPKSNAKYVLELKAGTAKKLGMREGDRIDLTKAQVYRR